MIWTGIKEKSRMKKEHGDRLARALEFANESAEYHVRNYAGGTLMPGDAYADLPIDERDRVYLDRMPERLTCIPEYTAVKERKRCGSKG